MESERVPLLLNVPCAGVQPVTAGIPFPRGWLQSDSPLSLWDANDTRIPIRTFSIAHWGDGSIQWLLVEFLLRPGITGHQRWHLKKGSFPGPNRPPQPRDFLECCGSTQLWMKTENQSGVESKTISLKDTLLEGMGSSVVRVIVDTFPDPRLARLRITLYNPQRAQHTGGLWDLGDAGSDLFSGFGLEIKVDPAVTTRCQLEPSAVIESAASLSLKQHSSGGDNWNCRTHVDRTGRVPLRLRGYQAQLDARHITGNRASPIVQIGKVTVAVPEFWQQFPRSLEVGAGTLRIGLFPKIEGELHELQGGEQKTHAVWLWCEEPSDELPLQWVHNPATIQADPEWVKTSGTAPYFAPTPFVQVAVEGDNNLFHRREIIDEYGWRNYGEVYADHENAYFKGEKPIVSHYNNQYDMILGFLQQFMMTGDPRWWQLADPLARHVIDIDIYHTKQDRAAYSGGPFWHTDHYRDAGTSTHRAYSRVNAGGQPYGGGPSNEHAYTTGLLYYYYLTGELLAAGAVREVADWLVNMDDGEQTVLGLADDGPTGLSSQTRSAEYHGPGRGAGNAIHSLLNACLLTREQSYLDKAEELIRRCIHPLDDINARNLLDIENGWSYTVFLSMLVRYLDLKRDWHQLDPMYDYARRSLLHYAAWMRDHELPYLDQRDKLEFPTETWAAQDLRKANVMRFAALLGDTFDTQLWQRGEAIAARAWADLMTFETRTCARPLAIVLIEGPRDAWLKTAKWQPLQHAAAAELPPLTAFASQRQRIKRAVKSPRELMRMFGRLLNVWRWPHYWSLWRRGGW